MNKLFGSKKREEHAAGFTSQLGGEARSIEGTSATKHLIGTEKAGNVRWISIEKIKAKKQIREEFNEEDLQELAASIKEHGQQQASTVYWSEADHAFVIVAGERRFRAAKLAGMDSLKCDVLHEEPSEAKIHELQLVENVQRKQLGIWEEARAYQRFIDEFGCKQADISKKTGKSIPTISKALKLMKLPEEIRTACAEYDAPKQLAESLANLKSIDEQRAMLEAHRRGEVTARQVEDEVAERKSVARGGKPTTKQQRVKKSRGIDLKATGKKKHTNTDFALATLDWCEDLATNKRAAVDKDAVATRLRELLAAVDGQSLREAA